MRYSGGEAASLREAPLPPDPSLPKSGWRLGWLLLHRGFRLRAGMSPIDLVESTAADRAAADDAVFGKTGHRESRWREAIGFRPLTKSSTVFSNGKKQEKGKATSNK